MHKINKIIYFCILILLSGCSTFWNKPETTNVIPQKEDILQMYDSNALKTTDITYKLQADKPVYVYDKDEKKIIKFTEEWFVVHKDILKTMNENQDLLTKILNENKHGVYIPHYAWVVIVTIAILMLIYSIFIKSKRT